MWGLLMNKLTYTYLLSQFIGLFMFVLAIIVMLRLQFYRKIILSLNANNPVLTLAALVGLALGLFLVLTHNIFSWSRATWVTGFSWVIFLGSVLWLLETKYMLSLTKKVCSGIGYYWVLVFLLVFGMIILARSAEFYITNYGLHLPHSSS